VSFVTAATGRPRRFCSDRCRVAAWRKRHREPKPHRLAVHFSSKTDEWATPQQFFDEVDREFGFDLDACATPLNAKCERYFTRADDGLAQEWAGRVWLNPPYGRSIGDWMAKAWEASQTTAELVVCLVPVRTDTRWWHEHAAHGEVRFLRGRLKFGDAENSAPFPSALVVFRNAAHASAPTVAVTKPLLREAA
jgi:phage N-6-adenine-methyltransferase